MPDLISSSVTLDLEKVGGYDPPSRKITNKSLIHTFLGELKSIVQLNEAKKILIFLGLNICGTLTLLIWCHATNSMALTAYTYLTIFDLFSLLICLLSIWVRQQKPSPAFSFGYERFEVLATFASTMLAQLGSLFIVKESIERMIEQPEVHTGRLLVGLVLAFIIHMFLTYSVDNRALNHVMLASSSSWLQEHMTDISESVCHIVPGLSKLLLPRINPLALIAFAGGFATTITYILIDTKLYYSMDTFAAMLIAVMTCGTMFPMAVYTGKILLQTTPSHMLGQLDKVLREASTLDGVLEFRHEHFWTLSFGTLAGSVQVRVRRDADEQLVLAHVYSRLSNIVSNLTIQIFKDDWTRASTFNLMGNPAFSQNSTQVPSSYTSTLPSSRGPSPTQDLSFSSPMGASFKPVLLPQPEQFGDYQSTDHSNHSLQTGSHSHGPSYQFGQSHSHSHSHGVPKHH